MMILQDSIVGIAHVIVALHFASLLFLVAAWHSWIADHLRGALAAVRRWLDRGKVHDEMDEEVAGRLHVRIVEVIRRGATVMSLLYLAMATYCLADRALGNRPPPSVYHLSPLLSYSCMLVPSLAPLDFRPKHVTVWYSLIMALQCLDSTPPFANASANLLHWALVTQIIVAGASIASMQKRLAIAWLLVYYCFAEWGAIGYGNFTGNTTPTTALGRLAFAVATGMLTLLMEARLSGQLREQIQSEILQERQSAINVLLDTQYDAVVELDSELRIAGQEERLARFLSSSHESLEGHRLQEFLLEEQDRELFSTRIPECLGSHRSLAEAMNLHMRAGDGRLMQVEAFCIYYWGLGSRARYLLGLRESGEAMGSERKQPPGSGTGQPQAQDAAVLPEDIKVKISTSSYGLPVLECSEGFRRLIGGAPEQMSFPGLLAEPVAFGKWLQLSVNTALECHGNNEAAVHSSLVVTLHPRFGRRSERIRATCRVDAICNAGTADDESSEADSGLGPPPDVSLLLCDLRREPAEGARGSGRSSSSSSSSGERPQRRRRVGRGTQPRPDQQHRGSLSEACAGGHLVNL